MPKHRSLTKKKWINVFFFLIHKVRERDVKTEQRLDRREDTTVLALKMEGGGQEPRSPGGLWKLEKQPWQTHALGNSGDPWAQSGMEARTQRKLNRGSPGTRTLCCLCVPVEASAAEGGPATFHPHKALIWMEAQFKAGACWGDERTPQNGR